MNLKIISFLDFEKIYKLMTFKVNNLQNKKKYLLNKMNNSKNEFILII